MGCTGFLGYGHHWLKWTDLPPGVGALTERSPSDPKQETRAVGIVLYQERACLLCGEKELRKVTAR